jgi:hypothetical protein
VRLDLRQRIIRPADDLTIIDDSYNASPLSMQAALDMLQTSAGSTIAVLGTCWNSDHWRNALTGNSEQASSVVDWLIVRGPRSAQQRKPPSAEGFPQRIIRAGSNSDAVQAVQTICPCASPGRFGAYNATSWQGPVGEARHLDGSDQGITRDAHGGSGAGIAGDR